MESLVLSAITGKEIDDTGLSQIGERIYNLQRAILLRQGAIIERADFEKLKSEYYELRGWEVKSGRPTETGLRKLELGDVAADLKVRDLLR